MIIKALTVSQPFASLIADGSKFVENRVWQCSYRGPLAIHAGKGSQYLTKSELAKYPTGCVIAVCNLVACVELVKAHKWVAGGESWRISPLFTGASYTVGDVLDHEHTEGPWCWILEDVRKLKQPVPYVGKQGLWHLPQSVIEGLYEQTGSMK